MPRLGRDSGGDRPGDRLGEPPTFLLAWGTPGTGDGQFNGPHGIVVAAGGVIYVADTGNNRIQRFTSDGTFLLKWGTAGAGDGQFSHPHGIDVDASGNVFVAETGDNRVQKFSSDGTCIPPLPTYPAQVLASPRGGGPGNSGLAVWPESPCEAGLGTVTC